MANERSPVHMLCTYRPKPGKHAELLRILREHWPALRRAGLATREPAEVFRCDGKRGGTWFVEAFSWVDEGASERAHTSPEVMAVWGPMEGVLESMELARVERLELGSEPEERTKRRGAAPRRAVAKRRRGSPAEAPAGRKKARRRPAAP